MGTLWKVSFFVMNRKVLVIEKKSVLFYEFLSSYGNRLLSLRKNKAQSLHDFVIYSRNLNMLSYFSRSDFCSFDFKTKSLDRKKFDWYTYVPTGVTGFEDPNNAGPLQWPLVIGAFNTKFIIILSILLSFA